MVLTLWLAWFAGAFIAGHFGTIMVFLATYWIVRQMIGLRSLHPSHWPYVTVVTEASAEFREQCDFFKAASAQWQHKYDFGLTVKQLYRVDRPNRGVTPSAGTSGRERKLFHGTQREHAKAIIADGFRLPSNPGMFGKGIYFADCPLKSWRYCFASRQLSLLIPETLGQGGLILMCWVDLGTTREERVAAPSLTGYNHRGWYAWLTRGRGAYDSVVGVTEEGGGALRVPEYVIYNPDQAHITYMFEVMQCSKQ